MSKEHSFQVAMLNTLAKIRLAPSDIHGVGVFAMRDIPKGEKLYADNQPEYFDLPYSEFDK